MKILLVEPFFEGSHQSWAKGFKKSSKHEVKILSLPGRHWKWRMYGGAVALAKAFLEMDFYPDLLLATDMLDLTTFLALSRSKSRDLPTAIYFHENQITYPWSATDQDVRLKRNNQYGFINYTSALAADQLFFNSHYHLNSFIQSLTPFLSQFPDFKNLENVELIRQKSEVLYLGMDLKKFDKYRIKKEHQLPVILWNHRWEYDKNPELFFQSLFKLAAEGYDFQLIVLGNAYQKKPPIFAEAKKRLASQLIHWGYCENFEDYARFLWQSTIYPVTSNQDFFGGSVVQALYCGVRPLLPKRLAYPEHIPEHLHAACFYQTDQDFYLQLRQLIGDFLANNNSIVDNDALQNFVSRYDWSTLGPLYDHAFSKVNSRI